MLLLLSISSSLHFKLTNSDAEVMPCICATMTNYIAAIMFFFSFYFGFSISIERTASCKEWNFPLMNAHCTRSFISFTLFLSYHFWLKSTSRVQNTLFANVIHRWMIYINRFIFLFIFILNWYCSGGLCHALKLDKLDEGKRWRRRRRRREREKTAHKWNWCK